MGERLRELLLLFGPTARRANTSPIHWIGGGDAGPDWCFPCCRAVARHQRRTREYPEAHVDGGWDHERESDVPSRCHGCGRLLGYSLTTFGLGQEIAYWLDDAGKETLSPEQAYEVEAVLEAADSLGSEQDISDAVAIGERMAPLLATSPAPRRPGGTGSPC